MSATLAHPKRTSISHRREKSVPHEVKETLDAVVTETQDGERYLNNYVLKDIIGQGAFGTVNLAYDKDTKTKYAIKEFSKSRLRRRDKANYFRRPRRGGLRGARGRGGVSGSNATNHNISDPLYLIRSEVAVLKKLNHDNVVKLYEVLDDPNNDSLYMVFEMCENGVLMDISINKKTTSFPEDKMRLYFREMILGFEYLHNNGIVHRDIKPDNLLLSKDGILKIVDFGVSEMFVKGNDKMKKSAGSPAFMAPELCVAHHGEISGQAADIWSMGVTLYCLAFGCLPFEKDNIVDLYESIKNDEIKIPEGTDPDLVDLFHKILEKDPEKRITMPELREHPWVTEKGTDRLITTEENCSDMVTDITDDDLKSAIKPISMSTAIAVIVAGNKWRRISKSHQHMSSADLEKFKSMGIADEKKNEKQNEETNEVKNEKNEKNITDNNETTITAE
ncbi:kinase-like domain-containing protein [Glomus cerebriforme]|uniref:Kinase-like domain-containing protein n=1 Tax=Glomus cerebriforme TaxID=658196 RepID=A0A397TLA7_9GLOM|nr:kinase-like domain-containing protein [Glomus cerebriforme]